ncbi:MAG: hypothetical protein C0507_17285 [Cyanobacteria bacterium PR.3.49]|nr:hypothetical protein [Cyanobacteria bacterium PR.3.49]
MTVKSRTAHLPRIILLVFVFVITSQCHSANAQEENPNRNIPSFGEPRDGYIHMTFKRFENSFNTHAASRGLPIRLIEKPQAGLGHVWDVSTALLISTSEDITRKNLADITLIGFVRTKKHKRRDNPPFDWQTFLQYIDVLVQTVEPQLTTQERAAVMARTGFLRFPDPLQFPPYFLRFEHNSIEYTAMCKRDKSEWTEGEYFLMVKGAYDDPQIPPQPPQKPEDIQVVPGATTNE